MDLIYQPIGVIHSPLTSREGAPIQGGLAPEVQGRVEIFPEYEDGLLDLEDFSHIILLYHFHLSKGYKLKAMPFIENVEHGVFAIRAPRRPNPIGMSVVRLEKRDGRFLHVAELDILDQTPLLDIKPYVPAFDHRSEARCGWLEKHLASGKVRTHSDSRFK